MKALPDHLVQSMGRSLSGPVQAIQSNQTSIESLTVELRKNSVIESSLHQSGWRGVGRSLEAIATKQNTRADRGGDLAFVGDWLWINCLGGWEG
ncbi:MAG: hypothetical protein HC810_01605 [Acaryochloridaceae cyanobacterium RL_2_7]|nr:hypothetical protein [Acaryochloridaceae cyanobacterium RL_2_7]